MSLSLGIELVSDLVDAPTSLTLENVSGAQVPFLWSGSHSPLALLMGGLGR